MTMARADYRALAATLAEVFAEANENGASITAIGELLWLDCFCRDFSERYANFNAETFRRFYLSMRVTN